MTATRVGVLGLLTMVAVLRPLSAQQRPLALGQWVRVVSSADSTVHKGRLILVIADTVVLDDGRRIAQGFDFVPLDGNTRVELPRHVRSHPPEFALLGASVGMAAGALSFSMSAMLSCAAVACTPPSGQLIGRTARVVLGGLVGAALGALVGAHVYTTLWDPVPPDQVDRLRVGMAPQPRPRLGLGVSLGF